jgi:hypothetical protein
VILARPRSLSGRYTKFLRKVPFLTLKKSTSSRRYQCLRITLVENADDSHGRLPMSSDVGVSGL